MTRLNVQITPQAAEDIREIADYLSSENRNAARLFELELKDSLQRLSEQPGLGHAYGEFAHPVYVARVSARFRRYLIFYRRMNEQTLRIVRVLHGARDIQSLVT